MVGLPGGLGSAPILGFLRRLGCLRPVYRLRDPQLPWPKCDKRAHASHTSLAAYTTIILPLGGYLRGLSHETQDYPHWVEYPITQVISVVTRLHVGTTQGKGGALLTSAQCRTDQATECCCRCVTQALHHSIYRHLRKPATRLYRTSRPTVRPTYCEAQQFAADSLVSYKSR